VIYIWLANIRAGCFTISFPSTIKNKHFILISCAIQMHEGALYLGVDAWQSPNGYDIIGTVVYRLLDNGPGKTKLDAMPLDFVQLDERHTGEYLA
jgi:hypothetical protein